MTARDFCYWLQGFLELSGDCGVPLSAEQTLSIRKHLSMVFAHEIDPSFPKEQQPKLNHLHNDGGHGLQIRC